MPSPVQQIKTKTYPQVQREAMCNAAPTQKATAYPLPGQRQHDASAVFFAKKITEHCCLYFSASRQPSVSQRSSKQQQQQQRWQ